MKITKDEARRIVLNCSKDYRKRLLNKKMIIIYRDSQEKTIHYIEVGFYEKNYQHLTGLELIDKKGNVLCGQSKNFYRKCVDNKLGINEFQFRKDGTTPLKLKALPVLMDISRVTKITGNYNNSRPYLFVDKVVGGVNFCLGLSRAGDEYVPSSALLEDIKKITDTSCQVLAILQKEMDEVIYSTIKHVAKGLNLSSIQLPKEINDKISLENYIHKSTKQ